MENEIVSEILKDVLENNNSDFSTTEDIPNLQTIEDLYYEIGKSNLSVKTVCQKIIGSTITNEDLLQKQIEKTKKILTTNSETGVVVEGLSNPQIKLGQCCLPIPGDKILGYITKGNGIVVHHSKCNNLKNLGTERCISVDWATNISRKYPTCIKISAMQRDTLIGDLMTCINSLGMGIASLNAVNTPDLETVVKIKLLCKDKTELNLLIVNMKKIPSVFKIERDSF